MKDYTSDYLQEQNSSRFTSDGAAWQWAVDDQHISPEELLDISKQIGLGPVGVIEVFKLYSVQGKSTDECRSALQNMNVDQKEDYIKNTAAYNLQSFTDGIADSVNMPAISTGFSELDKALAGGLRKGLYMLGGIPSVGKTSLVLQIADQIAAQGHDVLFISMEMEKFELLSKSISRGTAELATGENAALGDIRNAKTAIQIMDGSQYQHYSDAERDLIRSAINRYEQLGSNIYIIETSGNYNVLDVRNAVERHKNITGNLPIVIVDYIQILTPLNERATDKTNIDKAVRELKLISRDYKTPVIGISSFNRTNYNNSVALDSFKESGNIEYSGDVVIGLQYAGVGEKDFNIELAKKDYPRKVDLMILKNRNGESGSKVPFNYYAKFNLFSIREDAPQEFR